MSDFPQLSRPDDVPDRERLDPCDETESYRVTGDWQEEEDRMRLLAWGLNKIDKAMEGGAQ